MLNESKIEMAINSKVIYITKHIMNNTKYDEENALKLFMSTKLYKILLEKKSGLYLEPVGFLIDALHIELEKSEEAMREYIYRE